MFDNVWQWLSEENSLPNNFLVLGFILVGMIIAGVPLTWRYTKLAATWVHEVGHATVALLTGRGVSGIRINGDASGDTGHIGRATGLGRLLTAFAGYPAPSLVSLGIVAALFAGHLNWVIIGFLVLGVLMIPLQRSLLGFFVTIIVCAASYLLVQVSPFISVMLVSCLAGYLLVASPRTIIELHYVHRQNELLSAKKQQHSDAMALTEMTGLPPGFWEVVFMGISLGCIWMVLQIVLF